VAFAVGVNVPGRKLAYVFLQRFTDFP